MGANPPSSPTAVERPILLSTFLSAWNTSTPMRSPSGNVVGPDGNDHELLGVHVVGGVGATVQDVHHRHREHPRHRSAQIAIQRQPAILRRGPRHRERHARIALAPSLLLFGVPSASIISASISIWSVGGPALQPGPQHLVHVADRLAHALAAVALGVAIAQLDRFVLPGRRAAGHCGSALGSARQNDLGLDSWIPAAVQDFAARGLQ